MKIDKQHTLAGIDTFWLIPSEGANLDDIIGKEMAEIVVQAMIEIQVRKDSLQVTSRAESTRKTKTLSAFHPGDDQETGDYLKRISRVRYYIVARSRSGDMFLLNTSPTEFRYEKRHEESLTGESGFSIQVETESDTNLVKVLTLSLKNIIADSNFDTLIDSNGDILRS